ncbi:hypothetical protein [Nitrospira sp. M1]
MTYPITIHSRPIISLLCFLFTITLSVSAQGQDSFILNADDTQAKKWMELSTQNRASFVFGFLAGLDHVYNAQDLVVTLKRPLSAQELSSEVYKSLLDQPELRNGPIDEIILHALQDILSVSTKSGSPVGQELKAIYQR